MSRSRVQIRISFLREWWEWFEELLLECSDAAPESAAGAPDPVLPVSPPPETEGCRSSVLSIFCCLVFITRPPHAAPQTPSAPWASDAEPGPAVARQWYQARSFLQREIEICQRGGNGGFGAHDHLAHRRFAKARCTSIGELVVGPAAFGADGERDALNLSAREDFS